MPTLDLDGYSGRALVRQYLALSGVGLDVVGRRHRPRPRLRRRRRARRRGARRCWAGRCRSSPAPTPIASTSIARASSTTTATLATCGATRTTSCAAPTPTPKRSGRHGPRGAHAGRAHEPGALHAPTTTTSRRRTRTTAAPRRFSDTSPVAGAVWHATRHVNAYASYGEGFETPTFAEIAYRTGGTGLNFALQPATSRAAKVGIKASWSRASASTSRRSQCAPRTRSSSTPPRVAARRTRTPAARAGTASRRCGTASCRYDLHAHVAYTWLRAVFADAFTTRRAAPVVRRRAAAGRARAAGLWRARLDAGRAAAAGARRSSCNSSTAVRQRAQHRRRAGLYGGQRARRLTRRREAPRCSAFAARQQPLRPQLRRLGDRRRYQWPLLRAGARPQLVRRHQRRCHASDAAGRPLHARRVAAALARRGAPRRPVRAGAGGCRQSPSSRPACAPTPSTCTSRSALCCSR